MKEINKIHKFIEMAGSRCFFGFFYFYSIFFGVLTSHFDGGTHKK